MNIAFAIDGYVAESSIPLLFVFDGYLYVAPNPPIPSGGGGGSSNYSSRHDDEENKRIRLKKIQDEDDIILSIIKAFLVCQN